MSQLNDISLVAQVVVFRNTRAFDQLVQKYQSPVRRFFLNLTCGDSELSDDLAQDTFIKAYTNIANFKNLSSFSTWLYRIAYNVFYDYIRKGIPKPFWKLFVKAAICLWNSAMGSQRKTNCKAAFLPEKSSICAGHRTQWCFVYRKPVLTPAATWIFSVPNWGFLALCVLFVFSLRWLPALW